MKANDGTTPEQRVAIAIEIRAAELAHRGKGGYLGGAYGDVDHDEVVGWGDSFMIPNTEVRNEPRPWRHEASYQAGWLARIIKETP